MGSCIATSRQKRLAKKQRSQVLMVGLDGAGKTTILKFLTHGEFQQTEVTVGFEYEEICHRDHIFRVWDVGGQEKQRKFWRHYYQDARCIIFVIDAATPERFPEAQRELHFILHEGMIAHVPLLIFCNKQDLPTAATAALIQERMALGGLAARNINFLPSSGLTGVGVTTGFDWVVEQLK